MQRLNFVCKSSLCDFAHPWSVRFFIVSKTSCNLRIANFSIINKNKNHKTDRMKNESCNKNESNFCIDIDLRLALDMIINVAYKAA